MAVVADFHRAFPAWIIGFPLGRSGILELYNKRKGLSSGKISLTVESGYTRTEQEIAHTADAINIANEEVAAAYAEAGIDARGLMIKRRRDDLPSLFALL